MKNNSRNGKYNTTNVYALVSNISGNIVAEENTRTNARNTKRGMVKDFGLKNTDIRIVQLTTSIVR